MSMAFGCHLEHNHGQRFDEALAPGAKKVEEREASIDNSTNASVRKPNARPGEVRS
jgi:hypothetical protein